MADIKEAKESTKESAEAEEAEASFGFNDPRYADLQLQLIVSSSSSSPPPVGINDVHDVYSSAVIHGLHDNDSSGSTTARKSESGGNTL